MKQIVNGVEREMTAAEAAAFEALRTANEPVITAKADIWRRCSDLEAQMLDGALADAPAQLRRIFDAAQYIDHSDAFFPVLRSAITDVLGQTRADEILAGS